MKEKAPSPYGCQRPHPPCDCLPHSPQSFPESFFLQRILGYGRLHQRRKCYNIHISTPPLPHSDSLMLTGVSVCGTPAWEEICCHERGAKLLQIMIPLALEFRDGDGCRHHASGVFEEKLRLCLSCQPCDAWRGQILIQAAARLCGTVCVPANACLEAPLELILCGYLLSPCAAGVPSVPCPPSKPWYPQPHFNPYQDY